MIEIGYFISPAFQRKGYAKEAIIAMLQYLNDYYDIPIVIARIHPENLASNKLIESLPNKSRKTVQPDYIEYVIDTIG